MLKTCDCGSKAKTTLGILIFFTILGVAITLGVIFSTCATGVQCEMMMLPPFLRNDGIDNYTDDGLFYRTYGELKGVPRDIPDQAKGVYLFGNRLTHLLENAFVNLSVCLELDLGFNFISKIDPGAFTGLSNVENLSLTNNPLTELKGEMWQGLKTLKRLDACNCEIYNIEPNCFSSLHNLDRVNLQDNSLKEIRADMLNGLHSLKKLFLCCNDIATVSFQG